MILFLMICIDVFKYLLFLGVGIVLELFWWSLIVLFLVRYFVVFWFKIEKKFLVFLEKLSESIKVMSIVKGSKVVFFMVRRVKLFVEIR